MKLSRMNYAIVFRCFLTVCGFLSSCSFIQAQDTIVKLNNTRILSKVLEVNPRDVKYKKFLLPDGPVYILDRRHISRIIYSNGVTDTFSVKNLPVRKIQNDPRIKNHGLNQISLVVSDLFFGMISVGYERVLPGGKFSLKIPFSMGFIFMGISDSLNTTSYQYWNDDWGSTGYYYSYKNFSTGLDLLYYPGGQGTLRYFIGPALEFAQFNYRRQVILNQNYTPYYKYEKDTGTYWAFLVKNGLLFQPSKSINLSANIGAGFFTAQTRQFDEYNGGGPIEFFENSLAVEIGLNFGYKF